MNAMAMALGLQILESDLTANGSVGDVFLPVIS